MESVGEPDILSIDQAKATFGGSISYDSCESDDNSVSYDTSHSFDHSMYND
ncbi:hypothetical protein [Mucilaginibacter sp.]|uniref:hypothetical protein n=1 Tax=Mucilaginibacter sp. TaxID=1882438 RepID=UPI002844A85C|nr:hypothetical protein [Mucilaginibacter sp.]MDR3694223.1 hypothetical protein [Mucilaginibacter sp.]